jgi:hypothetical protein
MKQKTLLTITSLVSILLMTFHLAGDALNGRPGTVQAGVGNLYALPILVVWLYGTLVLAGRRSGYVILLLGSILGLAMPFVHMTAPGGPVGGEAAKSGGAFFFVWTLIALGVTAMFSLILAVRELWSLRQGQPGG